MEIVPRTCVNRVALTDQPGNGHGLRLLEPDQQMGAVRPAALAVATDMPAIDVPELMREGREARRQIVLGVQLHPKWKRLLIAVEHGAHADARRRAGHQRGDAGNQPGARGLS